MFTKTVLVHDHWGPVRVFTELVFNKTLRVLCRLRAQLTAGVERLCTMALAVEMHYSLSAPHKVLLCAVEISGLDYVINYFPTIDHLKLVCCFMVNLSGLKCLEWLLFEM